MLTRYINSLLLASALLFSSAAMSQEEYPFPDTIRPAKMAFDWLRYDSLQTLVKGKVLDSARHPDYDYTCAYLFDKEGALHLAVRDGFGYWVTKDNLGSASIFNPGYLVSFVNFDDSGNYEVLVRSDYLFSKADRYGGITDKQTAVWLISTDKKEIISEANTYNTETYEYTGFRVTDDDSASLAREEEEYGNADNHQTTVYAVDYTTIVGQGRVVFEYIDFRPQDPIDGPPLDTVFSIQYDYADGVLKKGEVRPKFKNEAGAFGYKILKGKVGKYPITMHLTQTGRDYEGYYYYDNKRIEIPVSYHPYQPGSDSLLLGAGADEYFRGIVKDSIYTGQWTNGKQQLDFTLKEQYPKGSVPLKAYSYGDSYEADTNKSYGIGIRFLLADEERVPQNIANDLNDYIKMILGGSTDMEYIDLPQSIFRNFRENTLGSVSEEMFDTDEENNQYFNSNIDCVERYNDNGLLCLEIYSNEYTGGARVNHNYEYLLYDTEKGRKVSKTDLFIQPDSLLYPFIKKAYDAEHKSDTHQRKAFEEYTKNYAGNLFIIPGYFCFYYKDFVEAEVRVPMAELYPYLVPGYRKRLERKQTTQ